MYGDCTLKRRRVGFRVCGAGLAPEASGIRVRGWSRGERSFLCRAARRPHALTRAPPPSAPAPRKVWKLRRFPGGAEHNLRADVSLVSTTREAKPWGRPPISMSFQARTPGAPFGGGDIGA